MASSVTTDPKLVSLRDVYGKHLPALGEQDARLVVLDADLAASSRTAAFKQKFPDRYLNIGIAEQNMVGIAAGIALVGDIPIVNTFASFLSRRAADQIAISVAYPNLNVKFFGFHGGINLGEDGATQQAVEDLGIMQAIPGIRVYVPIDAHDLERVMNEVVRVKGPTYVRLSRFPSPIFTPAVGNPDEAIADYSVLQEGSDLLVLTTGTIAFKVLQATHSLAAQGLSCKVVGITRIKPLGEKVLELFGTMPVAVVEEHNIHGGLADALSAFLDKAGVPHLLNRIGIPDRFGESGPPDQLLESFGLAGKPLEQRLQQAARR